MTIFPGCKCCGPCWKCYGKEQSECCQTDAQGAGFHYAELVESGAIPPGDSSGLSLTTDGKLQLTSMLTRTENLAGCKAARSEFGVSGVGISGKGISANINWLDGSPPDWKGPFVYLRYFGSRGNNNGFAYETWITKVSFAGTTINGGEGCVGVAFFPDAKCNIPANQVWPPSTIGNDPQKYEIQSIVPTESFTGLVEIEWLFQARERDPNIPGSDFVIISEDSGTFSFEWNQVVEMAACLPCGEDPDKPVDHQCFDAPPTESGWTPVGDCHPTEEECAKECPPFPCQEPCSAPFQVAGYAAKDKLRQFIGDGGTTGKPYPYAPSVTGWLNSTTNSIDALTNDAMSALMESDVVQFGKSKSIRFSTAVIKKTNVQECQAAATMTIIDTPSITSLSSGQITIATQSLPSTSDVAGTSAVISVSIDFSDSNNPTRIMRMKNISFGGLDFPVDSSLSNVTFIPKSWCSELFQPDGFRVFQLDQERWVDGWMRIDFYLADQSAPGIPQRDYSSAWYWPDSFMQPYCEPCEDPPTGGRTMPQTKTGPGTHLKEMLEAWGIHAKKGGGCKCKDMEVRMNRLGSACKEPANLKMIVDHLQAEAKKRKLPFVRKAGELLVLRAVKRFEKES